MQHELILIDLGSGILLIFSETPCITGDPRQGGPILLPQIPGARRVVVISPEHAEEFLFDDNGQMVAMTERRFDLMALANAAFQRRAVNTGTEAAPEPVRASKPSLSALTLLTPDWRRILADAMDFRSWRPETTALVVVLVPATIVFGLLALYRIW